jgi:hypothetical protein
LETDESGLLLPVKATALYNLGLLMESDVVSLSSDMTVAECRLLDQTSGAVHRLHPLAETAIRRLGKRLLFHRWLLYMLDEQLSPDEITEIIFFLNRIGALNVERSPSGKLRSLTLKVRNLLLGSRPAVLARRTPASVSGIITSALILVIPLVFISVLLMFIMSASGFSSFDSAFYYTVSFIVLVWLSTAAHEIAHYVYARNGNPMIFRRGLKIAILHQELSQSRNLLSAVSGPLAGVGLSLLIGVGMSGVVGSQVIWLTGCLVALFHLFNLFPLYSDGRVALTSVRRRLGGGL